MDGNSCRLCLSKGQKFINALAVPELSKSVKSFLGFEILPTDLYSKIVCSGCVKTISDALWYKNRVVYNQECIREQMVLHSQMQNVAIKVEEDDDDVILVDATPDKANDITQEVSSTQDCVPSAPQNVTKLTARKSTAKQSNNPTSNQNVRKTLCPKKLKVLLKSVTEKDLKKIRISKRTRSILRKVLKDKSTDLKVATIVEKKRVNSELGKKLVKMLCDPSPKKITQNGTKQDPGKNNNSQASPQVNITSVPKAILTTPPVPSITIKSKCSSLNSPSVTNADKSNVNSYKPTHKVSNAIAVTDSKAATIQFQNKPNGQNRVQMPNIIPAKQSSSHTNVQMSNIIPAKQSSSHTNVQMSVVPFRQSSPKNSPIVIRRFDPANPNLPSGFQTVPPQFRTNTIATPAIPSAASIQHSIPGSTLTYGVTTVQSLSNFKPVAPKPPPQVYSQNMTPLQPHMLNSVNNRFISPLNKVKVLTVNELNTRVSSPSSPSVAENNPGSNNSTTNQRLPIRISLTKVRNQMNIRLSNTTGAELHCTKLNESEKAAVRNSLLSKESIKRFAEAFLTTSPDEYTAKLLETLGLSVSSFF